MDKEQKNRESEIPAGLEEFIRKKFPGQEILLSLSTDVTSEGTYGEEWLVLTKENILIMGASNGEYNLISQYPINTVTNALAVSMVGGGVLEIESKGHTYRAIFYTNATANNFARAAKSIQKLAKEGKIEKEMLKTYAEEKRIYCEKCGKPIPEIMETCPRCVRKKKTLLRLSRFVLPYTKRVLYIVVLMSLTTLFGLVTPYIGKIIVDDILKPLKNAWLLGPLALILLVAHAGQIFFGAIQARISAFIGYMVIYDIRGSLYQKLQELSLSFYDKRQTGAIMARVTSDTREVQRFLTDWIPETLQSFFMIIGIGVLLFVLSWKLTLFIIAPIVATIWFLTKIWPRLRVYYHRYFEKRSRLSALVNDRLSGIRVIKSFGQERTEFKKFDERNRAYRDAGILVEQKWATYHPFLHFIIMLGTIIVWYVGGKLVFADEMTLGDVIAYSGYLAMFYRPVRMLTRMVNVITNSISAGERIFGIIDTKPEILDSPDAVGKPDIKGKIEFRNAVFGYNKSKPVLKNINIKIEPCEMIGLVGHSGAGKSTTINLICRLYDVDEGEILIDDTNIKDISYTDFRKQIGVVLQEPFLFNGTIADNIAYSKPGATKLEIIRAAKTANAHEFIMSKPDGYDTNVGERGLQLSAGERQRISIARAILHDPRILILDEATSSVDTETEKQIQEALSRLIEGRTTIAIAHRLSTLRNCDRLLVLEHGEQVELGTHGELMKKKGTFYRLVRMQEELSRITTVGG